ncbi:activator protein [Alcanivorax jadensis]|uniref:activator protein n=1 Tax=Alcanivorax jadensis TaxID=64988 RepID=UPI0026F3262A|nr:activator protein [Alcanivorax jadensis]
MIRNIIASTFLVWASVGVTSADVTVAPAGAFSASGKLAMKKGAIPVSCHTTFNGQVSEQGAIRVTEVIFGGMNPLCKSIKALALPWQGQVDNPGRLTVDDMQVKVRVPLLGGICGPGPVTLAWGNTDGSATFDAVTLGPDCAMDGTMVTTPQVDIRSASQSGRSAEKDRQPGASQGAS